MNGLTSSDGMTHPDAVPPPSLPEPRMDAGPPPWLYFWMVMWLVFVPQALIPKWNLTQKFIAIETTYNADMIKRGGATKPVNLLFHYTGFAVENLATFILLASILWSLAWRSRMQSLQRIHGFQRVGPESAICADGIRLLSEMSPRTEVYCNWNMSRLTAYVIPTGWLSSGVVLFGGFAKLFRKDRPAAEAILMHEVAHLRRGDYRVVGMADFLRSLLFLSMLGSVLVLAFSAWQVYQNTKVQSQSHQESLNQSTQLAEMQPPTPEFQSKWDEVMRPIREQHAKVMEDSYLQGVPRSNSRLGWAWFYTQGLLCVQLAFLFKLAASLSLPVASIWCAELHADRFVVQSGYPGMALDHLSAPESRLRRLLQALTHPPGWLRRMFGRPDALMPLLLLYPCAMLIRLILLLIFAFFLHQTPGMRPVDVAGWISTLAGHGRTFLVDGIQHWVLIVALLLLWPCLAPYWERFFAGRSDVVSRKNYFQYVLAAFVPAMLLGLGIYFRVKE